VDLQAARTAMIDSQVRPNDVTDRRLIGVMASIPREAFVTPAQRSLAYADVAIETGPGRWMMAPRDFSKLVFTAAIKESDKVLDVGPGTGYSTAVLAGMGATVVALEHDEAAAKTLRVSLARTGVVADVVAGPLKAGAPSKAPFDVIFLNGAVEDVPNALLDGWLRRSPRVGFAARGSIPARAARRLTARRSIARRRRCPASSEPPNSGSDWNFSRRMNPLAGPGLAAPSWRRRLDGRR
jgi:protein-L-isoaspartate(D-aspartate) O-methyltransferase